MMDFGGFEHNLQSLRVVDLLEEHYADFDGLNLSFECREGILKHCSYNNAIQLGELGERFASTVNNPLRRSSPILPTRSPTTITTWRTASATLTTVDELPVVPLFRQYHTEVQTKYLALGAVGRRQVYEILRRMINHSSAIC